MVIITNVGIWQMLLPFFVANVIPLLMLADVVAMLAQVVAIFGGRCYYHFWLLADVIAICLLMVPYLADVVAILWLMLLPLVVGNYVAMLADVIAIVC